MVFSAGSVRDMVYSGISPFPSSVIGVLAEVVNNAIIRVGNYAGVTLSSASIDDKFRPAVTNFATANALSLMAVQDNGVKFVSVGEESVNNENLATMAKMFEELGNQDLKTLNTGVKFYKARG